MCMRSAQFDLHFHTNYAIGLKPEADQKDPVLFLAYFGAEMRYSLLALSL